MVAPIFVELKKQASFFIREKIRLARLALTDVTPIQLYDLFESLAFSRPRGVMWVDLLRQVGGGGDEGESGGTGRAHDGADLQGGLRARGLLARR